MSQVQHGAKMRVDLPSNEGAPMVRVNQESFFVNEVLQLKCGGFYIPERFFRACPNIVSSGKPEELMASGWHVERTPVSKSM